MYTVSICKFSERYPADDTPFVPPDTDPFHGVESSAELRTAVSRPIVVQVEQEVIVDPDQISPSPPTSRIPTPSTLTPSVAVSSTQFHPFHGSLRRLRTLTKGSLFTSRNPAPEIYQILPTPVASPATNREASSTHSSHLLPELSFDSTPLSVLIQEGGNSLDCEDTPHSSPQLVPQLSLEDLPAAHFALVKYEFVHPSELAASPADTLISTFSIAATPLAPPSPSWLSRNVHELELLARQIQPHLQIEPPSPNPLPILLRGALDSKVRPL